MTKLAQLYSWIPPCALSHVRSHTLASLTSSQLLLELLNLVPHLSQTHWHSLVPSTNWFCTWTLISSARLTLILLCHPPDQTTFPHLLHPHPPIVMILFTFGSHDHYFGFVCISNWYKDAYHSIVTTSLTIMCLYEYLLMFCMFPSHSDTSRPVVGLRYLCYL